MRIVYLLHTSIFARDGFLQKTHKLVYLNILRTFRWVLKFLQRLQDLEIPATILTL